MAEPFIPTLADQIVEVRREIGLRQRVYRRAVENGSMPQSEADRRIEAMRAALNTLLSIQPEGGADG